MIRRCILFALCGAALCACKPTPRTAPGKKHHPDTQTEQPPAPQPTPETPAVPRIAPSESIVAVRAVRQDFNLFLPWEKEAAGQASALGVYLGNGRVLTVGSVVRAATYVEMALPDGSRTVTARVLRYDEDMDLALLILEHAEEKDFFVTRTPLLLGDAMSLGDRAEAAGLVRGLTPVTVPLEAVGAEPGTMPRLTLRLAAPLPAGHEQGTPIVKDGRLVGLGVSYGDMQIAAVNAELLARFLAQKADAGVPQIGVRFADMDDPAFCAWLKADTGLYISKVLCGGAAEQAGLREGDVVTSVDGMPIDNRGRCKHPQYGWVAASAMLRSLKPLGDKLQLGVVREGEKREVELPLNRDAAKRALFAENKAGVQPRYVVWGGLVFQPLTETYLNNVRKQNNGNLPTEFQMLTEGEETLRDRGYREIVALTQVIPTPATMGYEQQRFCMVEAVNGKPVHDFDEFVKQLDEPTPDGLVRLTLNKAPYDIYIDRAAAESANDLIRRRSIPKLRSE